MAADRMTVTILADGTIKFVCDPISMPNHSNAEAFLREVARLAGGTTTRERRPDAKGHPHVHQHHEHH